MTVAALYVDPKGPYPGLLGPDRCWSEDRNARHYPGPGPVVSHPPCGPWGRLRHLCTRQDASLGPLAVEQLARWGGVLEHPAGSLLWTRLCLPRPDHASSLWPGWRTVQICQCWWGHEAQKATWVLCSPGVMLPPLPPEPRQRPTRFIDTTGRRKVQGRLFPDAGPLHVPKSRRHLTPPAFALWLLEAAASVEPHRRASPAGSVQDLGEPCSSRSKRVPGTRERTRCS